MHATRGPLLTSIAILFVVLAVSDFLKPFGLEGADTGLVFLGRRLTGTGSAIAGPLLGLVLLAYAAGIWGLRQWVVPLAWIYAAYVVANVSLFPFRTPWPPDAGAGYLAFGVAYTILAIAGSVGVARVLSNRRADLR